MRLTGAALLFAAMLLWLAQPAHAMQWRLVAGPEEAAAHGGEHAHGHGDHSGQGAGSRRPPAGAMRHGSVPWLSDTGDVEVTLWSPDRREIALDGTRPRLPRTAHGYYQALVAVRRHEGGEESAIHYLQLRSPEEPDLRGRFALRAASRISPADLTGARKTRLEIVPAPLPREHRRLHEGMRAAFVVRLEGEPLEGATVELRTSNGTRLMERADQTGRVAFRIPTDFEQVLPGRRATPPAELVLRSMHRADGERLATTLTMPYSPHPSNWESAGWAVGLLAAGMVGGGLIGRRVSALAPPPRTHGRKRPSRGGEA
ncbi:hypothetical protein [Thioalkalivibrio thiocyanodenitrificans]|uniref:hypothetical protein n=1 Tax=Thioalkalivibrio thiocyanodenitrificans TaxID=243063 RepID=UPI0003657F00|nr:hypothetical protein [Thioalkalivibrio thiocyanodenitrificans]